jgi:hypothetical protein
LEGRALLLRSTTEIGKRLKVKVDDDAPLAAMKQPAPDFLLASDEHHIASVEEVRPARGVWVEMTDGPLIAQDGVNAWGSAARNKIPTA